jgi:hypothetical protein
MIHLLSSQCTALGVCLKNNLLTLFLTLLCCPGRRRLSLASPFFSPASQSAAAAASRRPRELAAGACALATAGGSPDALAQVIFVRSKLGLKRWMPLNVLSGGAQANGLVKGMEMDMTREASTSTLKREVARMIYKERVQMEETIRKQFPPMKYAKEIEYGMCILDRAKPRESIMGNLGVMLLPAEEEIGQTPVESVAAGAAGVLGNLTSAWDSFVKGGTSAISPPAGR